MDDRALYDLMVASIKLAIEDAPVDKAGALDFLSGEFLRDWLYYFDIEPDSFLEEMVRIWSTEG